MDRHTFTTAALVLASLPLAIGAFLWHRSLRHNTLWDDIDPFEIDLQLTDRNDGP